METLGQLESLKKALSFDRSPLCSGAISPSPEGLHLYYGKKDPRFIDFASATSEDLDSLLAACEPATFNRGNEDIYDEPHRKAFKMDASDFIIHPTLAGPGLMRTVKDQLLQSGMEDKYIWAEPYQLSICGEGSFFKAQKDTPRGTDVFGSLVIIYPTSHEGGELVLRHKDREWKFGAKTLTVSQTSPSLAYVAFRGDIEHEVLRVISGRRVTVTYNMYLIDPSSKSEAPAITTNAQSVSNLQTTLQGLLKSPEFLPDGGTLGFGLAHPYPFTLDTGLQEMMNRLKGEDLHVYRACRELQLWPSLQIVYENCWGEWGNCVIMLDRIVRGPYYGCERWGYEVGLVEDLGGILVNKREDVSPDYGSASVRGDIDGVEWEYITWVSPFDDMRNQLVDIVSYRSDNGDASLYCSPCIVTRIAAASDRV